MKYLKEIFKSPTFYKFRNFLNIRPIFIDTLKINYGYSISDSFIWRNDNNVKTIFRYSDLLKYFYNSLTSEVEINFYNKDGEYLKKINIKNIKKVNELNISEILNDFPSEYGTFNIFHRLNHSNFNIPSVRNSCYTGYSLGDNLPSFVHGNIPVYSKKLKGKVVQNNIINKSFLINQVYRIQDNFKKKNFLLVELFFTNPTNNSISVKFENKKYIIKKNGSLILNATRLENAKIISNCYYLRPIIFKYKKSYIDVHHG